MDQFKERAKTEIQLYAQRHGYSYSDSQIEKILDEMNKKIEADFLNGTSTETKEPVGILKT